MDLGAGLNAIAFFGFLAFLAWLRHRKDERQAAERDALYRHVMAQPGMVAETVRELMQREDERAAQKNIDDALSAGMVMVAIGIGLALMLNALDDEERGIVLIGAVPGLVGVALLIHAAILGRRRRAAIANDAKAPLR